MFYSVALSQIKYIPKKIINNILDENHCYKKTYDEIKEITIHANTKTSNKLKSQIINDEPLKKAEKIINECAKKNVEIINEESPLYPNLLKQCPDKPYVIYSKGEKNPNNLILLAIVGTRNCSNYGIEYLKLFLNELSKYKIGVVSGLAYGIDIEAHKISNELNLPNYAVLGSGVDHVYPREHLKEAKEIINNGMLISEYPPGTPPRRFHFPCRNRIIAGMSKSTIVIESDIKGGATITARLANEYNRDVFAIPGNINKRCSKGCNQLIANHQAQLISSPTEILDYIKLEKNHRKEIINSNQTKNISKDQRIIYNYIRDNFNTTFNNIQNNLDFTTPELNSILTCMELEGLILQKPGKIYQIF